MLAEQRPTPLERVGVKDHFGQVGKAPYLMGVFGITAADIAKRPARPSPESSRPPASAGTIPFHWFHRFPARSARGAEVIPFFGLKQGLDMDTVGIVGLGVMGSNCAKKLMESGVPVAGYDPYPPASNALPRLVWPCAALRRNWRARPGSS